VDSAELAARCSAALDGRLRVDALRYLVQYAALAPAGEPGGPGGDRFTAADLSGHAVTASATTQVRYDLIGELAVRTELTRRTVASILRQVSPATFAKYRQNPDQFITGCARLITEERNALTKWQEHA
jgi:type III restriction enzyme